MAKCILLLEDDAELGAQVMKHLREAGHEAVWWRTGRCVPPESLPDVQLVILDLMLPGVPGVEVLRDLRARSDVPVLVLSARDESADKVNALQLGADDYMTKPFWPEELVARVRARLRRPTLERSPVVTAGSLRIDRARREVTVRGERVELTRAEFEFLAALAERPGEPVTRRHLAACALDPERDGTARTLDVHVSRLRRKLGPDHPIETVWGIGYRLAVAEDA